MYNNINTIFATNKLANAAVLVLFVVAMMYSSSLAQSSQKKLSSTSLNEGPIKGQPFDKKGNAQQAATSASATAQTIVSTTTSKSKVEEKLSKNCTHVDNRTECHDSPTSKENDMNDPHFKSIIKGMAENRDMLMRTLYVTLGVTGVVVIYFVARSLWLRRKHTKSRKYGVKPRRGGHKDMEMEPLGDGNDDDDDDDYTVFEANGRKK